MKGLREEWRAARRVGCVAVSLQAGCAVVMTLLHLEMVSTSTWTLDPAVLLLFFCSGFLVETYFAAQQGPPSGGATQACTSSSFLKAVCAKGPTNRPLYLVY